MRFISNVLAFGMQIRPYASVPLATGQEQVIQDGLYIKFIPGDLTDHEVDLAHKHFNMFGFRLEEDEVTRADPRARLSSFDTELEAEIHKWTPEDKALVEQELTTRAESSSFILYVEPTPVMAPWPRYDEWPGTLEKLLERLLEEGHDLSEVIRYERLHQGRDAVIGALTNELERQEADDRAREYIPA